MMDFLAKLFNPSGPMDLATGKTATPSGKDVMGGIGKGVGIGNILADAIGGMATPVGQAPAPNNSLETLLKKLNLGQAPQQQSPGEALMQRLFGLKPTNPTAPGMPPIQVNRQLPSSGIQGGTGGLY